MYTFDLSKASKLGRGKGKKDKKPNPDAADTPALVKEAKDQKSNTDALYLSNQTKQANNQPNEQQPKESKLKRSSSNNFCPTY